MKKLVFIFVLSLFVCSFGAFAQIKVDGNGNVGKLQVTLQVI